MWCLRTSEKNMHVGTLDVSDEWYTKSAGVQDFPVAHDVQQSLSDDGGALC